MTGGAGPAGSQPAVELSGGGAGAPWIVLPGLHGDRTLHSPFIQACAPFARIASIAYPRQASASLADYARFVEVVLRAEGITGGWLVAESFGSQVAWALIERCIAGQGLDCRGLVLAGGFVRYPWPWRLHLAQKLAAAPPASNGQPWPAAAALRTYPFYAWVRSRGADYSRQAVERFMRERRQPGDAPAIRHRLDLISRSDFRDVARRYSNPVWQLTGFWDPIVPWGPVGAFLRRECPGWRGRAMNAWSDHTVLFSAAAWSAGKVSGWIGTVEGWGDSRGKKKGADVSAGAP